MAMLSLVLFLTASLTSAQCSELIVFTTLGEVNGSRVDITATNAVGSDVTHINMFLGIPYAEAPVGSLRFARPVPKSPWKPHVLDAKHVSPACPQPLWFLRAYSFGSNFTDVDEDCLYLNIYMPSRTPSHAFPALPVLVWVHGGAYHYGSGAEFDGRILAQEGMIVVTLNYRLGTLGFLSTDDDHAPGNYGLMDQLLAIDWVDNSYVLFAKYQGFLSTDDDLAPGNYGLLDQLLAIDWVKKNIASFHGDPNRITIAGQSAGGGSVSLHMFSQKSKGLFQAAIPQSGCALSPWAIYRPPHTVRTYTVKLAHALGCNTSSSRDIVTCLRQKSASDIANTRIGGPPMISTFAPRVDGFYITELPEVLLERGQYLKEVQVMTGYVPQETSEDLEGETGIDQGLTQAHLEQMFYTKSRRYLDNADVMYHAMLCAYPPSPTDVYKNRQYAVDMGSDYGYVAPHIKMAAAMGAQGTNVWLYDFTFRSALTKKKDWIGVPHAEELYYEFGAPFLRGTPCPGPGACPAADVWGSYQHWAGTEKAVSLATMKIWADFATLGHYANTFHVALEGGLDWPPYKDATGTIMNITSPVHLEHLTKSKGIRFWESYNYLNVSAPVTDPCGVGVPVGK